MFPLSIHNHSIQKSLFLFSICYRDKIEQKVELRDPSSSLLCQNTFDIDSLFNRYNSVCLYFREVKNCIQCNAQIGLKSKETFPIKSPVFLHGELYSLIETTSWSFPCHIVANVISRKTYIIIWLGIGNMFTKWIQINDEQWCFHFCNLENMKNKNANWLWESIGM